MIEVITSNDDIERRYCNGLGDVAGGDRRMDAGIHRSDPGLERDPPRPARPTFHPRLVRGGQGRDGHELIWCSIVVAAMLAGAAVLYLLCLTFN